MQQKISKASIIKKTIEIIERDHGTQNITLRTLARAMSCSHTNLYNHIKNIDDLFWSTLNVVMIQMMGDVLSGMKNSKEEDLMSAFLDSWINFCFSHEGLYRLIWMEHLQGEMPEEVQLTVQEPMKRLTKLMIEKYKNIKNIEHAEMIAHHIIAYTHGEMSIFVSNRSQYKDESEAFKMIHSNTMKIFNLLLRK